MPVPADIAERVEKARALAGPCRLCERRCGVDRYGGERGPGGTRGVSPLGFCRVGERSRVFQELLHAGEELVLVPSHVIYLTGCNFRCVYCLTGDFITHRGTVEAGVPLDPDAFAAVVARRRAEGATNVNFCGGEPSVNLPSILELLARCPADTRVVWNSNMYFTPETAELLRGVVDVYLADWKYGNDDCARRLSVLPAGYVEVMRRNIRFAVESGADVIVRHLVLPGHAECCFEPIAAWLAESLPGIGLSVLEPYVPFFRAAKVGGGLERASTREEADDVRRRAERRGLRLVS